MVSFPFFLSFFGWFFFFSFRLLSQFPWLDLDSFFLWTLFLSFHPSPFQASGGGATRWATAPGTPVNSDSAIVTMSEAAAAEVHPTSESDPEIRLNASAAPFSPAARPTPRKPPRRHGA